MVRSLGFMRCGMCYGKLDMIVVSVLAPLGLGPYQAPSGFLHWWKSQEGQGRDAWYLHYFATVLAQKTFYRWVMPRYALSNVLHAGARHREDLQGLDVKGGILMV